MSWCEQNWNNVLGLLPAGVCSITSWVVSAEDTVHLRQAPEPLADTRILNFMSSYGGKRGGTYQQSGALRPPTFG
jgi:hypothetical protein